MALAQSAQQAAEISHREKIRPTVRQIVGTYIACGLLWILFSDAFLGMLVQDPETLVQISLYKGFAFVGITALILYLVTRRSFAAVEVGFSRLRAHKREIERFNRLYQAFSRINHEVLTAADKDQLLSRICQLLVEQGGFQMAWVGSLSADGGFRPNTGEIPAGEVPLSQLSKHRQNSLQLC